MHRVRLQQMGKLEIRGDRAARAEFLFEEYEPRCYLFIVYEILRRIFLTGVLSMFRAGTISQIAIGLLATITELVLVFFYALMVFAMAHVGQRDAAFASDAFTYILIVLMSSTFAAALAMVVLGQLGKQDRQDLFESLSKSVTSSFGALAAPKAAAGASGAAGGGGRRPDDAVRTDAADAPPGRPRGFGVRPCLGGVVAREGNKPKVPKEVAYAQRRVHRVATTSQLRKIALDSDTGALRRHLVHAFYVSGACEDRLDRELRFPHPFVDAELSDASGAGRWDAHVVFAKTDLDPKSLAHDEASKLAAKLGGDAAAKDDDHCPTFVAVKRGASLRAKDAEVKVFRKRTFKAFETWVYEIVKTRVTFENRHPAETMHVYWHGALRDGVPWGKLAARAAAREGSKKPDPARCARTCGVCAGEL
ncbi:hypothetical protein JL721_7699 [Aureococcus anophagefferens]|nr:hypothetical protein JL721_7699 [Aureococcus anophagefferens]